MDRYAKEIGADFYGDDLLSAKNFMLNNLLQFLNKHNFLSIALL